MLKSAKFHVPAFCSFVFVFVCFFLLTLCLLFGFYLIFCTTCEIPTQLGRGTNNRIHTIRRTALPTKNRPFGYCFKRFLLVCLLVSLFVSFFFLSSFVVGFSFVFFVFCFCFLFVLFFGFFIPFCEVFDFDWNGGRHFIVIYSEIWPPDYEDFSFSFLLSYLSILDI